MMDVPSDKGEAFYKHMGHSEQINKDVYQAPMALNEVMQVGKHLLKNEYQKDSISAKVCKNKPATQEVQYSPAIQQSEVISISGSDNVLDTHSLPTKNSEGDLFTTTKPIRKASKARKYYQWADWEWDRLNKHFVSQIQDISQVGTKGPLPSKVAISAFLKENNILKSLSEAVENIKVIKTKNFNERTKFRR